MSFKGLSPNVFEAFAPSKWSSMAYNLERMKAKDALTELAQYSTDDLVGELTGLARANSDEIPNITNQRKVDSLWVYWFRDTKERESLKSFLAKTPLDQSTIFNIAPQDKHATLAVIVREQELWVGLRIAPGAVVDRRNLASKLEKSWLRENLDDLIGDLPDGALIGFEDDPKIIDEATGGLDDFGARLAGKDSAWELGHTIAKEDAVELGADLAEYVGRWLGVLAPVYRYAAWSAENDFIEATKKIQEEKAEKRRQARSYRSGDKVRIVSGLFAGKLGVVESIDTKAQVKVRVGTMSVVVAGTDLVSA